jgi:hypothetical protein
MSIEFIAVMVPILLGTVTLILGLLLVFQINQQQRKNCLSQRVSINYRKAKSNVEQTNFAIRASFVCNIIAQFFAHVLVSSGLSKDGAYVVSYCVVLSVGVLFTQLVISKSNSNLSASKSSSPSKVSSPKTTYQSVNYHRQVKADRLEEYKKGEDEGTPNRIQGDPQR